MSEQSQSFWQWSFGASPRNEQKEKVLQYVVHRLKGGARLDGVTQEEYVRRNLTQDEIDELIADPELVHAAREQMEQAFISDKMSPEPPTR